MCDHTVHKMHNKGTDGGTQCLFFDGRFLRKQKIAPRFGERLSMKSQCQNAAAAGEGGGVEKTKNRSPTRGPPFHGKPVSKGGAVGGGGSY